MACSCVHNHSHIFNLFFCEKKTVRPSRKLLEKRDVLVSSWCLIIEDVGEVDQEKKDAEIRASMFSMLFSIDLWWLHYDLLIYFEFFKREA